MKKVLFILCLFMSALTGSGAETSDTVAIISGATDVILSREGKSVTIEAGGSDTDRSYVYQVAGDTAVSDPWNIDLPFLRKKPRRFSTAFLSSAYIGFAIPANAPHGFRQSVDYGFPDIFAFKWRLPGGGTTFSVGAGIMGYKINLGGGYHFGNSGEVLTIEKNTDEIYDVRSSLSRFAISVPIRFRQHVYRGLGFSLGVIPKYNTYASAETRWKSGGMSNKVTITGLRQNPFSFDLELVVGEYYEGGFYVRYSPSRQFRKGYGPDFNVWSAGLLIYM